MATLYCNWDNTAVAASSNVTFQRVSWRERLVGGGFNTSSITPSNDMAKTVNAANFSAATVNKVYEFKVEALCTVGGPTINSNGIVENLVFECVLPSSFVVTESTIAFNISIPSTDITKARVRLKKQSDDSLIDTQTINKVSNAIDYTFTGLTASTGYYFEVEFYATVNVVEVISSSLDYLGAACGGNIINYTATTSTPANIEIQNTSLDVNLVDVQLDGTTATGTYAIPGDPTSYHNVANDGTVDVYIEWNPIASSGQHINVIDTNGTLVTCFGISTGDPTPFETITGVDMTGPNNLIIQVMDGAC